MLGSNILEMLMHCSEKNRQIIKVIKAPAGFAHLRVSCSVLDIIRVPKLMHREQVG